MFVLVYIVLYLITLIVLYILIIQRLKLLSDRHWHNTGLKSLTRWYRIIRRRMFLLLTILFVLGSLVILTFVQNDILYKTWLYDDKKALDSNAF